MCFQLAVLHLAADSYEGVQPHHDRAAQEIRLLRGQPRIVNPDAGELPADSSDPVRALPGTRREATGHPLISAAHYVLDRRARL